MVEVQDTDNDSVDAEYKAFKSSNRSKNLTSPSRTPIHTFESSPPRHSPHIETFEDIEDINSVGTDEEYERVKHFGIPFVSDVKNRTQSPSKYK